MYNFQRFSRFFQPAEPLSVLELVNSGTLDLRLACILWMMMEQRSSVVVSAGPSYAGKSTTLNMLLDFLPPDIKQVELHGDYEDFSFIEGASPADIYMVAEEFNTYHDYVWGEAAIGAFNLLSQGYSMGGTIHARTPREVVYIFHRYLGLSLPVISNIDAIVNLRITMRKLYGVEPLRQIESVCLLVPKDDAISLDILAVQPAGEGSIEFADSKRLQQAFSRKYGVEFDDIEHEISIRKEVLGKLADEGRISHHDVRKAIHEFYDSHSS